MNIKSVGEAGLIDRIKKANRGPKKAILGIGDDCAVLDYTKDKYLLVSADMLIEGVHFDLRKAGSRDVGRKALGVSLSDIAAMAGTPRYCTVSLGMPADTPVEVFEGFYSGFLKLAREFGVELVGGDTNASERFVCDTCIIGEAYKKRLVRRAGARPGDGIFVTGALGGSAKGAQYDFTPRVREAGILAADFKVSSMIDISDGLSTDLFHIARASGVGALIYGERVPLSGNAFSLEDALSAGEDFELLFTARAGIAEKAMGKRLGMAVTKIGEILPLSRGVKIARASGMTELEKSGYSHF